MCLFILNKAYLSNDQGILHPDGLNDTVKAYPVYYVVAVSSEFRHGRLQTHYLSVGMLNSPLFINYYTRITFVFYVKWYNYVIFLWHVWIKYVWLLNGWL